MAIYTIRTDADLIDDIEATDVDDAIDQALDLPGVHDLASLRRVLTRMDGAWCWIERDDERIIEIGDCP